MCTKVYTHNLKQCEGLNYNTFPPEQYTLSPGYLFCTKLPGIPRCMRTLEVFIYFSNEPPDKCKCFHSEYMFHIILTVKETKHEKDSCPN